MIGFQNQKKKKKKFHRRKRRRTRREAGRTVDSRHQKIQGHVAAIKQTRAPFPRQMRLFRLLKPWRCHPSTRTLVARRKKGTHYSRSRRSLGVSLEPARFLFRFQPEEKGCRRRAALSRDKGSFRLTARPLDGPKAPRLPSPPPSNLLPTSPPRAWKPRVQDVSHHDVLPLLVSWHACFVRAAHQF